MPVQTPTSKEILHQMSKVPDNTIFGKAIHQFLKDEGKTNEEIYEAAESIKAHIVDNAVVMKKVLGNAYLFFLTLQNN